MKIIYYFLTLLIIFGIAYSFLFNSKSIDTSNLSNSFYDYAAVSIDGDTILMSEYKGKHVLVVNVASKCGFTPQYKDLQKLSVEYGEKIEILGFPSNDFLFQEPGNNEQIKTFCSTNYGVSFQMFEKIIVKKNNNQHPLYSWLSHKSLNNKIDFAPSWNFCKYLINKEGKLVDYYNSKINPLDDEILKYIK